MSRTRQRGVALLVAIVIFAFATMVAAASHLQQGDDRAPRGGHIYPRTGAAGRHGRRSTGQHRTRAGRRRGATETSQEWAQVQQPVELEGDRRLDRGAGGGHERPLQPEQRGEVGRQEQDLRWRPSPDSTSSASCSRISTSISNMPTCWWTGLIPDIAPSAVPAARTLCICRRCRPIGLPIPSSPTLRIAGLAGIRS